MSNTAIATATAGTMETTGTPSSGTQQASQLSPALSPVRWNAVTGSVSSLALHRNTERRGRIRCEQNTTFDPTSPLEKLFIAANDEKDDAEEPMERIVDVKNAHIPKHNINSF